jgi:hypothetical protein
MRSLYKHWAAKLCVNSRAREWIPLFEKQRVNKNNPATAQETAGIICLEENNRTRTKTPIKSSFACLLFPKRKPARPKRLGG